LAFSGPMDKRYGVIIIAGSEGGESMLRPS
jgi:hypothetical protein